MGPVFLLIGFAGIAAIWVTFFKLFEPTEEELLDG
uniref:Uncharacterized protein n=1 Tax=viral metagenome TaxID=1070528 RepID=A0A6C0I8D4_9ZZZZ